MTPTPYAKDTTVTVPPCAIHDGGIGIVRRAYPIKSLADRWNEALQMYDVEIAGDVLWYAHHELEMIGELKTSDLMLAEVAA